MDKNRGAIRNFQKELEERSKAIKKQDQRKAKAARESDTSSSGTSTAASSASSDSTNSTPENSPKRLPAAAARALKKEADDKLVAEWERNVALERKEANKLDPGNQSDAEKIEKAKEIIALWTKVREKYASGNYKEHGPKAKISEGTKVSYRYEDENGGWTGDPKPCLHCQASVAKIMLKQNIDLSDELRAYKTLWRCAKCEDECKEDDPELFAALRDRVRLHQDCWGFFHSSAEPKPSRRVALRITGVHDDWRPAHAADNLAEYNTPQMPLEDQKEKYDDARAKSRFLGANQTRALERKARAEARKEAPQDDAQEGGAERERDEAQGGGEKASKETLQQQKARERRENAEKKARERRENAEKKARERREKDEEKARKQREKDEKKAQAQREKDEEKARKQREKDEKKAQAQREKDEEKARKQREKDRKKAQARRKKEEDEAYDSQDEERGNDEEEDKDDDSDSDVDEDEEEEEKRNYQPDGIPIGELPLQNGQGADKPVNVQSTAAFEDVPSPEDEQWFTANGAVAVQAVIDGMVAKAGTKLPEIRFLEPELTLKNTDLAPETLGSHPAYHSAINAARLRFFATKRAIERIIEIRDRGFVGDSNELAGVYPPEWNPKVNEEQKTKWKTARSIRRNATNRYDHALFQTSTPSPCVVCAYTAAELGVPSSESYNTVVFCRSCGVYAHKDCFQMWHVNNANPTLSWRVRLGLSDDLLGPRSVVESWNIATFLRQLYEGIWGPTRSEIEGLRENTKILSSYWFIDLARELYPREPADAYGDFDLNAAQPPLFFMPREVDRYETKPKSRSPEGARKSGDSAHGGKGAMPDKNKQSSSEPSSGASSSDSDENGDGQPREEAGQGGKGVPQKPIDSSDPSSSESSSDSDGDEDAQGRETVGRGGKGVPQKPIDSSDPSSSASSSESSDDEDAQGRETVGQGGKGVPQKPIASSDPSSSESSSESSDDEDAQGRETVGQGGKGVPQKSIDSSDPSSSASSSDSDENGDGQGRKETGRGGNEISGSSDSDSGSEGDSESDDAAGTRKGRSGKRRRKRINPFGNIRRKPDRRSARLNDESEDEDTEKQPQQTPNSESNNGDAGGPAAKISEREQEGGESSSTPPTPKPQEQQVEVAAVVEPERKRQSCAKSVWGWGCAYEDRDLDPDEGLF